MTNRQYLPTISLAGVLIMNLCIGCASTTTVQAPPGWFTTPPSENGTLLFVGDSTQQSDAEMARDLAVQKALFQLSLKVGAKIESRFDSKESETNGKNSQSVSLEMSIAGEEFTARGVTIRKSVTHAHADSYNAYVLIAWPEVEYQAIVKTQQNRAEKALRDYLAAQDAVTAKNISEAIRLAENAEKAVPSVPLRLSHPDIPDTTVLRQSLKDLAAQARQLAQEKAGVCAMEVVCERDGKEVKCANSRYVALSRSLTETGKKVSSRRLGSNLARMILDANTPKLSAEAKDSGCLVAIGFQSEHRAKSGPFIYINYSARVAVYDVESGRITHSFEVPPTKVGHVKYEGAMKKGFDVAQGKIAAYLTGQLKGTPK